MSKRILTDGDYRRASASIRAAADAYLSADEHPEDKARAARLTEETIKVARLCGVSLADVLRERKRELAELEGKGKI